MTTLNLNFILAARTHSATDKDNRNTLRGVRLDFPAGKMVATDGHRVFLACIDEAQLPAVTVPNELIDQLAKIAKANIKKVAYATTLDLAIDGDRLTFTVGAATVSGLAINGEYPDYMRVIPRQVSGESAQYNAKYIVDANKALRIAIDKSKTDFTFMHNGDNCGVMSTTDHNDKPLIIGIMPFRSSSHSGSNVENITATDARLSSIHNS
jgi:hypothetical protein